MGDYVFRLHAVGGHGCQREKKTGQKLAFPCGERHCDNCPDNILHQAMLKLQATGNDVKVATLTHWPADVPGYSVDGQIVDDHKTLARSRPF